MTHPYPVSEFGTGGPDMLGGEAFGDLPIRNFRDGGFQGVTKIHGGVIKDTIRVKMEGCFACPVRCKKVVKSEDSYNIDPAFGGPEYETLASVGSNCGIDNLKAICKGNELCNAYGLDSISTGGVISFAMECYEKGLLTKEETGGLELVWGNADAMIKAIELITRREGIGNLLAEGTARVSAKIGRGCESFAMHVKGLEPGMHEPRIGSGLAMGFMISPTGADHCHGEPDPPMSVPFIFSSYNSVGYLTPPTPNDMSLYKVGPVRAMGIKAILNDSLLFCAFPAPDFNLMVEIIKAALGWETGTAELMKIGERILTVMRLFNVREGLTEKDDILPERFLGPTNGGPLANLKVDREIYNRNRRFYYTLMGWDANGVPLPEKVEELSI